MTPVLTLVSCTPLSWAVSPSYTYSGWGNPLCILLHFPLPEALYTLLFLLLIVLLVLLHCATPFSNISNNLQEMRMYLLLVHNQETA